MSGNKKQNFDFEDEVSDDTAGDIGRAGGISDYTDYDETIDTTPDDLGNIEDYPAEPLGDLSEADEEE
jgi:hypothetical protein